MDDVNDIYYHNTRNPFNTATCQGQWNFSDSWPPIILIKNLGVLWPGLVVEAKLTPHVKFMDTPYPSPKTAMQNCHSKNKHISSMIIIYNLCSRNLSWAVCSNSSRAPGISNQ